MTITNNRGDSITFGRHFFLQDDFQISGLSATVNTSSTSAPGARYQSTSLEVREIDLPFYIKKDISDSWWIEEKREEAYRVFNPNANPMRIDFSTHGGQKYFVKSNLERAPEFFTGFENNNRKWQKGALEFIATDPLIYSAEEKRTDIALWVPTFEFALEIDNEGVEMGYRSQSLIVNVLNSGQEKTGVLIRFKALSALKNPSLINVNTYETFKLRLDMQTGDVVEVSTYLGNKYATLMRNNIKTNVMNRIFLESKFLNLDPGDNLFRYNADAGVDFLEVTMIHRNQRIGV